MKEKMKEIYIRSSDPYERGLQHGSQVKDRIERICAGYAKTFEKKGYTWDEAKAMAMEYVEFLDKEMPDLMMEVRGIADGSGQELAVIMLLNARYELLKFKKGVDYFENTSVPVMVLHQKQPQNMRPSAVRTGTRLSMWAKNCMWFTLMRRMVPGLWE